MENEEILGENEKLECSFNFMPFVTDVANAVSRCDIKKNCSTFDKENYHMYFIWRL